MSKHPYLVTEGLDTTLGPVHFPNEQDDNILVYKQDLHTWIGVPASQFLQQNQNTASILPWQIATVDGVSYFGPKPGQGVDAFAIGGPQLPVGYVTCGTVQLVDVTQPTNAARGYIIHCREEGMSELVEWYLPISHPSQGQVLKAENVQNAVVKLNWDYVPKDTFDNSNVPPYDGNINSPPIVELVDPNNDPNVASRTMQLRWNAPSSWISNFSTEGGIVVKNQGSPLDSVPGTISTQGTIMLDPIFYTGDIGFPKAAPNQATSTVDGVIDHLEFEDRTGRIKSMDYLKTDTSVLRGSFLYLDDNGVLGWRKIEYVQNNLVFPSSYKFLAITHAPPQGPSYPRGASEIDSFIDSTSPTDGSSPAYSIISRLSYDTMGRIVSMTTVPVGNVGEILTVVDDGAGGKKYQWAVPTAGSPPITISGGINISAYATTPSNYVVDNLMTFTAGSGISVTPPPVNQYNYTITNTAQTHVSSNNGSLTVNSATVGPVTTYDLGLASIGGIPASSSPGVVRDLVVDSFGRVTSVTKLDANLATPGQFLSSNGTVSLWTTPLLSILGDVALSSPQGGDFFVYDSTIQKWKNTSSGNFLTNVFFENETLPSISFSVGDDPVATFQDHYNPRYKSFKFNWHMFRPRFSITQCLDGFNADRIYDPTAHSPVTWPTRYAATNMDLPQTSFVGNPTSPYTNWPAGFWRIGQTSDGFGSFGSQGTWHYKLDESLNSNRSNYAVSGHQHGYPWPWGSSLAPVPNLNNSSGVWTHQPMITGATFTGDPGTTQYQGSTSFTVNASLTFCQFGNFPVAARLVLMAFPKGATPIAENFSPAFQTDPNAFNMDGNALGITQTANHATQVAAGMPLQFLPGHWEKTMGDGDMRTCRLYFDHIGFNTSEQNSTQQYEWSVWLEAVNCGLPGSGNFAVVPGAVGRGGFSLPVDNPPTFTYGLYQGQTVALGKDMRFWRKNNKTASSTPNSSLLLDLTPNPFDGYDDTQFPNLTVTQPDKLYIYPIMRLQVTWWS